MAQISPKAGLQRASVRRDGESQAACRQLLSTEEAPFPQKGCQAGAAQADRWREGGFGEEILRDENVQLPQNLH